MEVKGHKDKLLDLTKVKERADQRPDYDKAHGCGERDGMAREAFSLLRHTINTIKNCECPNSDSAMLRNNHRSHLPYIAR
jgi:hypothetical protein